MLAVVRMFRSEGEAQSAMADLKKYELTGNGAYLISPHAGDAARVVKSAIAAEQIPGSHVNVCRKALEQGQSIISVLPLFGASRTIEEVLDGHNPVPTEFPEYYPSNGTPLSDFLGLKVLADYKYSLNMKQITRPGWFATSGGNGDGLISKKATPLSSMLGMKAITANKSKNSSFGLPLLSKKAAPLSGMLGMKTVSANKSKNSSFGLRLLSKNPAPLSNLFNIPLLSRKSRDD